MVMPGIAIAFTVGFAASFLSEHYHAPAMLFALLLGMALNFLYEDERSVPGIEFSARIVLRLGVALLGFRVALVDVLGLGWQTLALILVGVVSTIVLGMLIARIGGLKNRFGVLSGGAVGICGASAALAISAVLPRDETSERDTAFVAVGVTALSTLAMIIYPILANVFELSDQSAGVFLGATIHDVAQVVGAGYSVSDTSGDIATLTKMMRVTLLLPIVLVVMFSFRAQHNTGVSRPPVLPAFLVFFVLFMGINSLVELPQQISASVNTVSRHCLLASIAAIGLKTNMRHLMEIGIRPVLMLVSETVWLVALTLLGLKMLGQA